MKILTLSNLYPPNAVGGYEILCFEVMQALAIRGHEITVLTSSYGGGQADYPNQHVIRTLKLLATDGNIYRPFDASVDERATINQNNISMFEQVVEKSNPDLIFVWNLHFYDPSLLEALQRSGRRLVYLLTDNWLIAMFNGNFISDYFSREVYGLKGDFPAILRRLKHKLTSSLTRIPIFSGSAIFASRFMEQLYRKAGLYFSDSVVIHHGVTAAVTVPVSPVNRRELVCGSELRLLFAGRVVEIKGVHTILKSLPHILKALPQLRVRLLIVGDCRDDTYLARLNSEIEQLGISGFVSFDAAVPEVNLFKLFQEHDIYLFPSLYEPFSLTLIHALQAGIPTVASNVGGNPEIVSHKHTGLLFNKGDPADLAAKVVSLVNDNALRVGISEQARSKAADFTFVRMVDQIEAFLSKNSRGT